MNNNIFDREIAENLKKLRVEYDEKSWERLERKLDSKDGEDIVFDRIIAGKLKAGAIPMSKMPFEDFEKRMNLKNTDVIWSQYIKYIVGVAAAFLLITFGFYFMRDSSVSPNSTGNSQDISLVEEKSDVNKDRDRTVFKHESSASASFKSNENVFREDSDKSLINNVVVVDFEESDRLKEKSKDYIADDIYNNNIRSANYGLTLVNGNMKQFINGGISLDKSFFNDFNSSLSHIGSLVSGWIMDFSEREDSYLAINFKSAYSNNGGVVDEMTYKESNYDKKAKRAKRLKGNVKNDDFENIGLKENIDSISNINQIKPVIVACCNNSNFAIKAYVAPSINFIQTPNDVALSNPAYNQTVNSIGGGMSLSYKNRRNEIEIGVKYANVSYTPRKVPVKVDGETLYLNSISSEDIEIPIAYKRGVYEDEKWNLYAIAGMSANFRTGAKYEFIEESEEGHILSKLAGELQGSESFNQTFYANKKYDKSISDGGKVKDNFFVSLNIGLGVKRRIGNGLSLFVEPQYNYSLSSFGPNNDKLSSVDFKFGISKSISL